MEEKELVMNEVDTMAPVFDNFGEVVYGIIGRYQGVFNDWYDFESALNDEWDSSESTINRDSLEDTIKDASENTIANHIVKMIGDMAIIILSKIHQLIADNADVTILYKKPGEDETLSPVSTRYLNNVKGITDSDKAAETININVVRNAILFSMYKHYALCSGLPDVTACTQTKGIGMITVDVKDSIQRSKIYKLDTISFNLSTKDDIYKFFKY